MLLLDVATPTEALGELLTSGPGLVIVAVVAAVALGLAAFFVFRKKK